MSKTDIDNLCIMIKLSGKRRLLDLETEIFSNYTCTNLYLDNLMKGFSDFRTSEKIYYYASHVIGGRWAEAEHLILCDPIFSFWYTTDIIKARWPEVEPIIKKDNDIWKAYCHRYGIL